MKKKKKKKDVAFMRMYIALPISNLAISDQLNVLNWNWFKVDKGGAHSLCKKYNSTTSEHAS